MPTPPEKNSASTSLMRMPVADQPRRDLDRRGMFGSRNMSTVSRAGTNSSSPMALLDGESQQADDDAAVQ